MEDYVRVLERMHLCTYHDQNQGQLPKNKSLFTIFLSVLTIIKKPTRTILLEFLDLAKNQTQGELPNQENKILSLLLMF